MLDEVYEKLKTCKDCRENAKLPELKTLPPNDFVYQWEPFRYPKKANSYAYLFLAWEPSLGNPSDAYPLVGSFNKPLQFAIERFLFPRGTSSSYLITNMAKCSIRTGSLCNQTREIRFETCAWSLKAELSYVEPDATIISIGQVPKTFIAGHHDLYGGVFRGRKIATIYHYSPLCNPHFKAFADSNPVGYHRFRTEYSDPYRQFLQREYKDRAPQDGELQRLFKWFHEIEAIRRGGTLS